MKVHKFMTIFYLLLQIFGENCRQSRDPHFKPERTKKCLIGQNSNVKVLLLNFETKKQRPFIQSIMVCKWMYYFYSENQNKYNFKLL
jgi:hypothetical protein